VGLFVERVDRHRKTRYPKKIKRARTQDRICNVGAARLRVAVERVHDSIVPAPERRSPPTVDLTAIRFTHVGLEPQDDTHPSAPPAAALGTRDRTEHRVAAGIP
jgi:hypothetical protein